MRPDDPAQAISLSHVGLLSRDPQRLMAFYRALLGFRELEALRSPLFRGLACSGTILCFHAYEALELLNLADRAPPWPPAVSCFATFGLGSPGAVDATTELAPALGGSVIKLPAMTYYHAWQAVLADPEGNVFRINYPLA